MFEEIWTMKTDTGYTSLFKISNNWQYDNWPVWEDFIMGRVMDGWPTRDAACPEEEC